MPRVPPVTTATLDIIPSYPDRFMLYSPAPESRCRSRTASGRPRLVPVGTGPAAGLALNRQGDAHAAADAQRGETFLRAALLHLEQKRRQNARAGCTDWMADGDGAAIDVHDRRIPTHVLVDGDRLRREGFVGLDKIKILDLPSGLFERFARSGNWPRPHHRRIDARGRPGDDLRKRRQARAFWLRQRSSRPGRPRRR